jgi:hypothetical protein
MLLVATLVATAVVNASVTTYPYGPYDWTGAAALSTNWGGGDGSYRTDRDHLQANYWTTSATGGVSDGACAMLTGFAKNGKESYLDMELNTTGKVFTGFELFEFSVKVSSVPASGVGTIRVQENSSGSFFDIPNSAWDMSTLDINHQIYLGGILLPTAMGSQASVVLRIVVQSLTAGTAVPDVYADDFSISGGALPIQLASFSGTVVNGNNVQLDWMTITEVNNYGFFVQRRDQGQTEFTELPNSFVPGHGTTTEPQYYTWTHQNVLPGNYEYRLRQVDLNASETFTEPIGVTVNGVMGVGNGAEVPAVFKLEQNYPNPFNPSTTVTFSLAEPNFTTLKLYNVLGQQIATLFSGTTEAGRAYVVNFDASNLGNGVYFYRLESGSQTSIKKMTLLK